MVRLLCQETFRSFRLLCDKMHISLWGSVTLLEKSVVHDFIEIIQFIHDSKMKKNQMKTIPMETKQSSVQGTVSIVV